MSVAWRPCAPRWAWEAKGLDAGSKLTWLTLWSTANYKIEGEQTVKFGAERVAERVARLSGQTERAVRGHLTKLKKLELISTSGRSVTLHWRDDLPLARQKSDAKAAVSPVSQTRTCRESGKKVTPQRQKNAALVAPQLIQPNSTQFKPTTQRAREPADERENRRAANDAERERARRALREQTGAGVGSARGDARGLVTGPHLDAVEAVGGAWLIEIERPAWVTALGRAIADLDLTPGQVGEVLRERDRQAAAGERGVPGRNAIWSRYSEQRDWLRCALGLDAPRGEQPANGPTSALNGAQAHWANVTRLHVEEPLSPEEEQELWDAL